MSGRPTYDQVEGLRQRLDQEAKEGGYHLNPDDSFTRDLVESLLVNTGRYGYPSCPCRLADGVRKKDLDIICPCDYRDPDLDQYGSCYCALYVSEKIARGEDQPRPIPERRLPAGERARPEPDTGAPQPGSLSYPVWRCRVCGYLCARGDPPERCPICRAEKDRFERFM